MNMTKYTIGVDFGTDSVRAVVIDAADGRQIAASVCAYPRWAQGLYCDAVANRFRQHPSDYLEGLETAIKACTEQIGPVAASQVCAIGVDTTGSTPVAVDGRGVPLALTPEFADDPDAMFLLWKDHTAIAESDELNRHAAGTEYLKYVGGAYSSEWFWAKLLHVVRCNPRLRAACRSWVEHCDWIPFVLTGGTDLSRMKRSVCAAGHKGLYAPEWGGYPPERFFAPLDEKVAEIASQLPATCYAAGEAAGTLSPEWAGKLGLSPSVVVSVGSIDAHVGAVGGGIEPYDLSMVIGTSTCTMVVAPREDMSGKELVPGICGSVCDSIIPGMIGMEAGQAAFGDLYNWFRGVLTWPAAAVAEAGITPRQRQLLLDGILPALNRAAAEIEVGEHDELALDWFNGRRSPDSDPTLRGAVCALSLGSSAPRIFRALVEATCFGMRAIVDRFRAYGVPLSKGVALGGISRKSPLVMQTLADVLEMPIRVSRSTETCALGAAMFAAVSAGVYDRIERAMAAMGAGFEREYYPDAARAAVYRRRYEQYRSLGCAAGR